VLLQSPTVNAQFKCCVNYWNSSTAITRNYTGGVSVAVVHQCFNYFLQQFECCLISFVVCI